MTTTEEIKESISLTKAGELFNIRIKGSGRGECPFCHSPTGMRTKQDRYFHCYRCGASGSVLDLLIHAGITNTVSESLETLAAHYSGTPSEGHRKERWTTYGKVFETYVAATKQWDSPREYAARRGWGEVVLERHPIGFSPYDGYLLEQGHDKNALIALGLLNEDGYEVMTGRVVFAIRNFTGGIVHFQGRSLDPNAKKRWICTKGNPPITHYLFNQQALLEPQCPYVFLTEGVSDCYSLLQMGQPAVACFGINSPLAPHGKYFKNLEVIAFMDRDKFPIGGPKAGQYKSWSAMMPILIDLSFERKVKVNCVMPPDEPGIKDINDYCQAINYDPHVFGAYVGNSMVSLGRLAINVGGTTMDVLRALKHNRDPGVMNAVRHAATIESPGDWLGFILKVI